MLPPNCTIIWILQRRFNYILLNYTLFIPRSSNYNYILKYFNSSEIFIQSIKSCNFSLRISKCLNFSLSKNKVSFTYQYEVFHIYLKFHFVYASVLIPFICVFNIVTNILIILVFIDYKNNQKKLNKKVEKMYKDMLVIAILNLVYCTLSILSLMSECVESLSIFCPEIRRNIILQYFNIIFIIFLKQTIKTFLNENNLLFSLNRYILTNEQSIGENQKKHFKRLNSKLFFVLSLLFCVLLNVYLFYEYSINDYDSHQPFPMNVGSLLFYSAKTPLVLKFLNYIVNNVLFLILEILVDIILLRSIKQNLKKKESMTMNSNTKQEISNAMHNANLMVFFNCLTLVFFRFIDLSLVVLYYVMNYKAGQTICSQYNFDICQVYLKIAEFSFILSNSFNFFFYYCFNAKFKESYKRITTK